MKLDASFVLAERPEDQVAPERQAGLNKIPPAERIDHPEIRAAIIAYEEARAAELEARRAHTQAELEIPAAEFRDEHLLADALASKKKDPGPVHADRQRALVADLKRKHGAAKVTLQRAVDAVREAFEAHGDDWQARLGEEQLAIREQMGRALDEFAELHGRLQVNMANCAFGGSAPRSPASFAAAIKTPRVGDGNTCHVADVLQGLRTLGAPQQPRAGAVANIDEPWVKTLANGQRVIDHEVRANVLAERERERVKSEIASVGITREDRLARAAERRARTELRHEFEQAAAEAVE